MNVSRIKLYYLPRNTKKHILSMKKVLTTSHIMQTTSGVCLRLISSKLGLFMSHMLSKSHFACISVVKIVINTMKGGSRCYETGDFENRCH